LTIPDTTHTGGIEHPPLLFDAKNTGTESELL